MPLQVDGQDARVDGLDDAAMQQVEAVEGRGLLRQEALGLSLLLDDEARQQGHDEERGHVGGHPGENVPPRQLDTRDDALVVKELEDPRGLHMDDRHVADGAQGRDRKPAPAPQKEGRVDDDQRVENGIDAVDAARQEHDPRDEDHVGDGLADDVQRTPAGRRGEDEAENRKSVDDRDEGVADPEILRRERPDGAELQEDRHAEKVGHHGEPREDDPAGVSLCLILFEQLRSRHDTNRLPRRSRPDTRQRPYRKRLHLLLSSHFRQSLAFPAAAR